MRTFIAFLKAGILGLGLATAGCTTVPPPAETPARVIVNGRTATAVDIRIVNVKQALPDTFSAPKVKSLPGYDWYVSQHFALRSQVDERQSRDYLTMAELAYPQYVWIFGAAPEGSDRKRIALSFSKNMDELRKATIADLGGAGWLGGGGGVTLNNNHVSYNYPGGGLQAHKRGLVMHENLHAFEMDLGGNNTPVWFTEGITYALEQHVYDPVKTQLTVMVLDRAVGNNHTDSGLAYMGTNFVQAQELWLGKEGMGYKPNVYQLWMQFLWSDVDRQMRQRVWLHERMARDPSTSEDGFDQALMEQLFDVPALNKTWHEWISARRNTFHHVDWGFEQEGDTFWSYGWPNWARYAQLNVNLCLQDAPVTNDPFLMDWPVSAAKPPTVGDVRRGVAEPSVGCVIDFTRAMRRSGGKGQAGLGFGVAGTGQRPGDEKKSNVDQEHLDILIAGIESRTNACLILDGTTIGLPRTTEKFAPAFLEAAVTGKQSVGMTVQIRKEAVEVALRTGPPDAMQTHRSVLPVTPEIRARLLSKPWCLLSKDSYHGFTLFPDVNRVETRDYSKPEPPGQARFLPTDETFRLYHAAWRLGDQAPASLLALQKRMLACAGMPLAAQQQALDYYRSEIGNVAGDVAACRDTARAQQALADLMGLELQLKAEPGATSGQVVLTAHAKSRTTQPVGGRISLALSPAQPVVPQPPVTLTDGQPASAAWALSFPPERRTATRVDASLSVDWNGRTTSLTRSLTLYPGVPRWWTLAPFDNKGDGTVDTVLPPETEPFNLDKAYAGQGDRGRRIHWQKKERPADLPVDAELVLRFKGNNGSAAYAVTWFESPVARDAFLGIGSDDGVVVWLNDERVHRNLVNRGYVPKDDRIPVHLKAGRNKLLMKVTQTSGPWQAGAFVLDKDGNENTELRYVDAPP
jgi:hypothetical protein